ncbi:hypothetical protein [Paenibacillus radicis (ex Gao et al. 2016)]|uniref:Uncharacterized protein n=1 Tax=Paenibacillus radicis (ex Gao et al. 2016) TaxID=1737354 RepID=A0A917HUF7_9BACL|nr:hypothetical protein [Paenibacillus radicis (ex Gao et al. 2016)]GGG89561.1 hypothetical protein GCM10010918_55430 [Paenibacillus radicis (ex Gao et al. 2016)]
MTARITITAAVIRAGLIALLMLLLAGCAGLRGDRSPEEWLSLSIAGLAATDNYAYKGQTVVATAEGWSHTPKTFQGKVVGHETIKAQADDGVTWNPVELLKEIQTDHKQIEIVKNAGPHTAAAKGAGKTVKLRVLTDEAAAREKWKQKLTGELDQLESGAPIEQTEYRKAYLNELNKSRAQLSSMLKTLQVHSEYQILIDASNLIPLSMEEQTVLTYIKDNKQKEEMRKTTMQFGSFDGRVVVPAGGK